MHCEFLETIQCKNTKVNATAAPCTDCGYRAPCTDCGYRAPCTDCGYRAPCTDCGYRAPTHHAQVGRYACIPSGSRTGCLKSCLCYIYRKHHGPHLRMQGKERAHVLAWC
eukprot:1161546-Pelagomonas_calceolata.AAC.5